MKIVDFGGAPDSFYAIPCNCGDFSHMLVLSAYVVRDEKWMYLSIVDVYKAPRGLWNRIGAAWQLFRKGEYCRSDVGLDSGNLDEIIDWCQEMKGVKPNLDYIGD